MPFDFFSEDIFCGALIQTHMVNKAIQVVNEHECCVFWVFLWECGSSDTFN